MRAWLVRNRWLVTGATVLVVIAGAAAWFTHRGRELPPSRAREYTAFDACLLTDQQGVSGPQAAPVWSGMQKASVATSGKVSFLAVYGPDTPANAIPYVNTLVQRHCNLVLAADPSEVEAARTQAGQFTTTRFVIVGSGPSSTNLTVIPAQPPAGVPTAVQRIVTDAANHANGG